jgi:hypothetical protein
MSDVHSILSLLPDPDDVPDPIIPDRVICPDCGAEIPNDGACFYCEWLRDNELVVTPADHPTERPVSKTGD